MTREAEMVALWAELVSADRIAVREDGSLDLHVCAEPLTTNEFGRARCPDCVRHDAEKDDAWELWRKRTYVDGIIESLRDGGYQGLSDRRHLLDELASGLKGLPTTPDDDRRREALKEELAAASVQFTLTDNGNADRLVSRFGRKMRYAHDYNRWLIWDGIRWAADETGEHMRLAVETVEMIPFERSA